MGLHYLKNIALEENMFLNVGSFKDILLQANLNHGYWFILQEMHSI